MADVPPPPDTNIGNENSAPNALADRSWERAWSLKEMRENAASWSLAGDAGLLQYLQDFSQKLVSRTHEIEKEVESLVHDSKMTTVRVNNVFNDFMMLANTQFVENRVYDEDESEQAETAATEEKKPDNHANTEKTREQREAELIPKVSEAIRLGVDVIEQAFEKLDTNIDDNSDNDEESDAGEISESEESEAEETKPAAGGKDSEYSYSESDSETEKKPPKKQKAPFAPQSSEDSDSEGSLFGTSKPAARAEESSEEEEEQSEDESDTEKPQAPPAAPTDFASELARKLGGAPPKPPSPTLGGMESGEEEQPREVRKKKKEKKKKEEKEKPKEDDLFGGGDDSEGDDIFGAGGTFGGKKTKEEEPVEPAEVKQRSRTRTTSTGKKLPAGAVPMFGGAPKPQAAGGLFDDDNDEDDLFGSTKPVAPEPKQEEDEDDMFATVGKTAETKSEPEKMAEPVKAPPEKRETSVKPKPLGGGLFDDDEDDNNDIFSITSPAKPKTEEKKKPPAGAVSIFPTEIAGTKKEPEPTKTPVKQAATGRPPSKSISMFEGDESDDEISHKQEVTPEPSRASKPVGGVSMFGRMNPFEPPSAAKDRPPSPTPDVDSKSEEVDPLFSEKADRAKIGAKRRPPSRQARKSAALSNDQLSPGGSASPLSSPTSLPTSPRTQDNDLDFDPSRVPPPLSDSPERVPSPDFGTGTSTDLFGNEDLFGTESGTKPKAGVSADDDDDDIFAIKKSKPKAKPSPIIEDDDDDIFASSSVNKPKSAETKSGEKMANGQPAAKKDAKTSEKTAMEDDDDLFAAAVKTDKKKTKKVVTLLQVC
ncbi:WASC2-like protein [Mya arenaria]|uniref:WASC2-like protein n=1 Tax=Mya arenaria TaxID=6604 RepID=A0ABY7F2H0_MYAAR|nr:WASC2-like protein [Mya arenaria]